MCSDASLSGDLLWDVRNNDHSTHPAAQEEQEEERQLNTTTTTVRTTDDDDDDDDDDDCTSRVEGKGREGKGREGKGTVVITMSCPCLPEHYVYYMI
jgi:hypothetical protein